MDTTMTRHLTAPHNTETHAAIHRRRRLRTAIALACAVLSAATTTVLLDVTRAQAANWMEVSCENPDQSAAPSESWTSFAAGGGYGSNNSTSCGPGSPMFAILSTAAAVGVGSAETLQYTPPGGSTLVGGSVDVSMYADGGGYNASGTAVAYTPNYAYDGSDVFFQCASGLPPCANGTYDFAGVLGIPANRGGNLYLSAGCGGHEGYACNSGGSEGAWSLVRLWWANLLLSNGATPAASGVSGTLLSPGARGTQELAFTASDPGGPGVYVVSAQVDGKTLYSATPDTNGGKCVPVGSSGGALMFDYSQPCRASESVDLPIDTASLADGQHTLKVTVQDAAQNASVVYDGAITTKNAPANTAAPTILAPSQVFAGAALSTHPGAWSAPAGAGAIAYGYQWEDCDAQGNNCQPIAGAQNAGYTPAPNDIGHTLRVLVNASDSDGLTSAASAATSAVLSSQGSLGASPGPGAAGASGAAGSGSTAGQGAPNGTAASETAALRLGVRRTISRSFARRAFRLTGRLIDGQGHPIGAATLDVLQQVAGSGTLLLIGHAKTRPDGSFAARVPAGPSRLIQVAYRAFSGDAGYAAKAKIKESVGAGVQLEITPRETGSTGTIVLSGRVLGPIPSQGVVVELLVHYRRHWEPFRDPRTDPSGHFEVAYQFEGGVGRFPFRAEVFGGQSGFPFTHGDSESVDVTTY
jgi:hypothetical protein